MAETGEAYVVYESVPLEGFAGTMPKMTVEDAVRIAFELLPAGEAGALADYIIEEVIGLRRLSEPASD